MATPLDGVHGGSQRAGPGTARAAIESLLDVRHEVGRVSTVLALMRVTVPNLRSFGEVTTTLGTMGERPALERLYCGIPSVDFPRHVLMERPDTLAVLPVRGVHWDDLGEPERVLATRQRAGSA